MTPRSTRRHSLRPRAASLFAAVLCVVAIGYSAHDRALASWNDKSVDPSIDVGASSRVRSDEVSRALANGNFPWYDGSKDDVRPMYPPETWGEWFWKTGTGRWMAGLRWPWKWSGTGLRGWGWWGWFFRALHWLLSGGVVATGLVLLLLAVLIVIAIELWRRYRPTLVGGEARAGSSRTVGLAARVEDLPLGVRPTSDDPWAEAFERRARGDLAGAVVCLFAHQLLTLDRVRQIRLAPGRTARWFVRGVDDQTLRDCSSATLRLFEDVYYGRIEPTNEAFERVWSRAQAFEERISKTAEAATAITGPMRRN